MESKYPVINLKLNGANQRLIGLAYQTIAKELNTDENLVDAIDNQDLDPTCLVYIYPNAKRLTFQQRLLTTMLNAKRNKRGIFYITNRFWHMREACKKGMLEKWMRLFESFTVPPKEISRPKTYLFPAEVGLFNKGEKSRNSNIGGGGGSSGNEKADQAYIIKPDDLACGKDIELALNHNEAIKIAITKNHVNKIQGESIIVQRYVDNPLLYKNRKFDLRIYLLIMKVRDNKIQYYFDRSLCFARIAGARYSLPNKFNQNELKIHLSNTTLSEDKESSKQDINKVFETIVEEQLKGTYGVDDDVEYWVCKHKKCKRKNRYNARDTTICIGCKKPNPDVYNENQVLNIEQQWENIENLMFATMHSISPIIALHYHNLFGVFDDDANDNNNNNNNNDNKNNAKKEKSIDHCFQVLGFDVMCTQKEAVLIEVNANASFALETELDKKIKLKVVREAFLSKTMPDYDGSQSFDEISPSFQNSERFLHNCFVIYSKFSSQNLKKPSSELAPLQRTLTKRIVEEILLEQFQDILPKKCIEEIKQNKIFRPPIYYYNFLMGFQQILSHYIEREAGIKVLYDILAAMTDLHSKMTKGMKTKGFNMTKPLALSATQLGWAERGDRVKRTSLRKLSPRVKGITNDFNRQQIINNGKK